ncbi:MAG TPA: substrate-binding domain-containing protein, partial [Treponemataceae bacterium]|nr:substrate-binding domain-containing protein [Treponemataceae bacterium]
MKTDNEARPIVGLLINQIEGRYQSLIRRGLSNFARERGVTLKTFVGRSLGSPYGNEDLFNAIYRLARGSARESAPDGLIVTAGSIGSFLTPEENGEFLDGFRPIPLVTIGMPVRGYASVTTDYAWGVSALVDHLVTAHGFRRFAFFKGPEHSPDAIERLASWRESLARHGIGDDALSVYQGDFTYGSGQELAARLDLSKGVPFDVISCANDDMALGFLQAMRKRGLTCPRDYAITGFDDIPDAGFLTPLLTTVHQPLYEQAYAAGTRLLALMGRADTPSHKPKPLVCAPIIRESCGCAEVPLITGRRTSRDATPDATRDAQAASLGNPGRGGQHAAIAALLAGEAALPGPAQEQAGEAVASLCDSATIDLRKFTDRPLFLQTLSGWLDMTLEWDDFSNRWHVLLSFLHRELLKGLADARARGYMEDLFASAFALLTRKSSERQARELSTLRNTMQLFRDLSQRLGSVADEAGLRDQLTQVAPLMGFSRVVVALHASGPKPFNRSGSGDFYRDATERTCVEGDVGSGDGNRGGTDSIYLPLLGRDRSYGYIILEGTGLDPIIFESLREQVSLSLESLALRES